MRGAYRFTGRTEGRCTWRPSAQNSGAVGAASSRPAFHSPPCFVVLAPAFVRIYLPAMEGTRQRKLQAWRTRATGRPRRPGTPARRTPVQVAGLRYYSPGLGRWTNRDPIGEMNWDAGLHGYLRNAPSGSVDLLGLISLLVAWGPDNDSTGNFPYYEDKLKDDLKKLVQDLDARLAG